LRSYAVQAGSFEPAGGLLEATAIATRLLPHNVKKERVTQLAADLHSIAINLLVDLAADQTSPTQADEIANLAEIVKHAKALRRALGRLTVPGAMMLHLGRWQGATDDRTACERDLSNTQVAYALAQPQWGKGLPPGALAHPLDLIAHAAADAATGFRTARAGPGQGNLHRRLKGEPKRRLAELCASQLAACLEPSDEAFDRKRNPAALRNLAAHMWKLATGEAIRPSMFRFVAETAASELPQKSGIRSGIRR
jgi:hypothetical protein